MDQAHAADRAHDGLLRLRSDSPDGLPRLQGQGDIPRVPGQPGDGESETEEGAIMERMYTETEAQKIVDKALRQFAASHPVPNVVTTTEAAEWLKVSPRTIVRMNPPRNGGKIPYAWVLKRLSGDAG
jgi:hypothetical protein